MFKIVWDERKRLVNLEKHGLDFEDVIDFEWSSAKILEGTTDDFGRRRLKAIGRFRDGTTVVIFAHLGTEAISIISFRHAGSRERVWYNGYDT
ncbi:BrnT family toxin [Rhizobium lemnae]|uniref:BrnT family toxin n=1 Tax=Rhizobium lemnae TaxID=1214924 RepID=A0ABV8E3B1_9HYPH|nr:BrnT family toxin [Rhizobium lemnae]MCJ8507523.1 BrnT family toxin [Rhizobium lemnae]